MIILDTNVISVMMQPKRAPGVIAWLDTQPTESIWTSSITLFELRFGLNIMESGKRKRTLLQSLESILQTGIAYRVLSFDSPAAVAAAEIAARLRKIGQGIESRDLQIAAITSARRAVLATRNVKHFTSTGIDLVNPWEH